MPHYTDEQARASEDRPREEVHAYYRRLAEQNRPAVERAIENLTGRAPVERTDVDEPPDIAAEGDDTAGEDSSSSHQSTPAQ